jgi:cytochrome b561
MFSFYITTGYRWRFLYWVLSTVPLLGIVDGSSTWYCWWFLYWVLLMVPLPIPSRGTINDTKSRNHQQYQVEEPSTIPSRGTINNTKVLLMVPLLGIVDGSSTGYCWRFLYWVLLMVPLLGIVDGSSTGYCWRFLYWVLSRGTVNNTQ